MVHDYVVSNAEIAPLCEYGEVVTFKKRRKAATAALPPVQVEVAPPAVSTTDGQNTIHVATEEGSNECKSVEVAESVAGIQHPEAPKVSIGINYHSVVASSSRFNNLYCAGFTKPMQSRKIRKRNFDE